MTVEQDEILLRKKARRRLIGAILLALIAVLSLPLVLDDPSRPLGDGPEIVIPEPAGQEPPRAATVPDGMPNDAVGEDALPVEGGSVPGSDVGQTPPATEKAAPAADPPATVTPPPAKPPAAKSAPAESKPPVTPAQGNPASDPGARAAAVERLLGSVGAATPKPEAPKPEASKPAPAKAETAKAETPKAETPKAAAVQAAATPAAEAEAGGRYVLQLGVFRERANASAVAAKASALGLKPVVAQTVKGAWRVGLGPYQDKSEALAVRDKVREAGLEVAVKTP